MANSDLPQRRGLVPGGPDDALPLRRAHALQVEFDGPAIRMVNFVTRKGALVTPAVLAYLRDLAEPTPLREAVERLPGPADTACALLDRLVEATVIFAVGTPDEVDDQRWADAWGFGAAAAALHFARRSATVIGSAERARLVRDLAAAHPPPPLALTSRGRGPTLSLPGVDSTEGIARVMARRRSAQRFARSPVTAAALARVLFTLVGVTDWVADPVLGLLPRSLSPSGGARNPYEAYVITHLVDGVPAGAYHYDQCAHTLHRLGDRPADMATLAGGQTWAGHAAFVVLLVAFLDRVWSKYPAPGGYLNLVIEAGHRAQNGLLAATDCGLGARMTTAIEDASAHNLLRLSPERHAAVYLLAFGHPEDAS
jgi:SagB-type dehydrogenase family enzyme